MGDEPPTPETPTTAAPEAEAPKKKRPSMKELIQRYGFLALGIYLSTAIVAFTLGMVVFGFFLDPTSWSGAQGEPPLLIAKLTDWLGLDSKGYWVVTSIASWLVFVKGSQIPRLMLTAALTPVAAKKLGREPGEEVEGAPEGGEVPAPVTES